MRLTHNLHLGYCTNIHRGEDWAETFAGLHRYTLAVRQQVCPNRPYGIGMRLSDKAARELSDPANLKTFRAWLDTNQCYVFTINGFPYGTFHGARVKEQVYVPDWSTPERLAYTNRLFDLLVELLPEGVEGSVSTLPCCFKELAGGADHAAAMRHNLWQAIEHLSQLTRRTGKRLHLGLEPEPLCYLETIAEVIQFFDQMRADRPGDERLWEFLGVNYDTCHLAVEFEEPSTALSALRQNDIRISKIHLSSALKVRPTPETRQALAQFADAVYLHQVVARKDSGQLVRYKDLDLALAAAPDDPEWRIHFHVPLHSPPTALFANTADHLLGVLHFLHQTPSLCHHLEMETYTWEVMPPELKNRSVVDQLVAEYRWTLRELAQRGFQPR
jgi:hypothetical protein